jgi:hypothetical protein
MGGHLQIVASLSITELVVLFSAPFVFAKTYTQMKRDGVMTFFWMSLLVVFGCIISSIANRSDPLAVIRGMAVTVLVSCSIIVAHNLLRRDPGGFKWFMVGSAISLVLSTFVFQQAVEVTTLGSSSEEIMSGPLFWIRRLGGFVTLPTRGWYLHMPWIVNVTAPLFMAVFSISTSVSGRSSALRSCAFVALVMIGGKTRKSMTRISKHFGIVCILGVIGVLSVYVLYKTAASSNWLGDQARIKYERQTQGGQGGIGRLLLGGRGESFIGLLACRDKPIIGWGPWAADTNGYAEEFIERFGTYEDVLNLQESKMRAAKNGELFEVGMIRCHAYITQFWLWYGIFGLFFWGYVIFIALRYLKQDVSAVPQWFAWLACGTPALFWDIFFNPFAGRFAVPLFVVACLMARAVRKGSFRLPYEMISEIERVERKCSR